MAQYDWGTINPTTTSGDALAADLNAWKAAVNSSHIGSSSPSYQAQGLMYWRTTASNLWQYIFNDGNTSTPEHQVLYYNPSTQQFNYGPGAFFLDTNSVIYSDDGIETWEFGSGNAIYFDPSSSSFNLEMAYSGHVGSPGTQVTPRWIVDRLGFHFHDVDGNLLVDILGSSNQLDDGNYQAVLSVTPRIVPNGIAMQMIAPAYVDTGPLSLLCQDYASDPCSWAFGIGDYNNSDEHKMFCLYSSVATAPGVTGYRVLRVDQSGNVTIDLGNLAVAGTVTGSVSDERLKTDIKPVSAADVSDFIKNVAAYRFCWNEDGKKLLGQHAGDQPQVSFIAQEVEKFLPEGVAWNDAGADRLSFRPLTISERPILAMHQAALRQIYERLEALESTQ